MQFSHEKLVVYQRAIEFVAWTQPIIESLPPVSARSQLDRSSTSIPLNIAEGNVKASKRDRSRFWQVALGSTVESAAVLDVLVARKLKEANDVVRGKRMLYEITAMLMTLIGRLGTSIADQGVLYHGDGDEDEDGDEDPESP